ncbi:MATE family efflux transporter [Ralstonia solanacearum]|uniref:MATE family efflux transporter n=1 Tax=Ralstonia solanacearum TaxID=305 RepID=UPI0004512E29|nr:MATE family efflux transporter [Ralstonia solanacearum]EUJ14493.1 multidrug transporter MatE [Ralstonia solanacearum P673]MCL9846336.1 MATE family efflux transporter [Ralstonia solanacearum]MCL9850221.1 MATE family efflux transporter [Ralstonia solanacearum]MCL9853491.1 MATE family efflux transporter [Ralstonia solanacearum]MCL9858899.1 MATE family efflux transporter [Ralstonia solanacearum]
MFLADLRSIAALAWPVLIGQLAVIAFGVLDTTMAGRASAADLAAIGLGGSIYVTVYISLTGVLQALAPIAGQLYGAGRHGEIGEEVRQAAWLGLALSAIGMLLLWFPAPLLRLADASPELTGKATAYLRYEALALPAALGFRIYSALNNALSRPAMVTVLQLGGLALKFPLNALFLYGGLGLPAMGGPGCALASMIISWLWCFAGALILMRNPVYRSFLIFTRFSPPHRARLWGLVRLGVPMGLTYLIEITSFTLMAIFIARMGTVMLAGHQIAANLGAVAYMVPLSLSIATSTLVAQMIGARDRIGARRIAWNGLKLAAACAIAVGGCVLLLRHDLARLYTRDTTVVAITVSLLPFIAFYQLFDALQVMAAFILRAYKIALIPTVIYALSLWGVGLGGGYLLGFGHLGEFIAALRGAAGFWAANGLSLAVAGTLLVSYFDRVSRTAE